MTKAPSSQPTRVLVTGGSGFIGGHLCERLLRKGYRVTAIDDLSTGRYENIAPLVSHEHFQFVRETINNMQVLDRLTSQSDVVVHLAAAVGVKLIVENPVHTIETNIMGTESVLKAALRYGSKIIITSTSEVYGNGLSIPFKESDERLMGPTTHSRWAYASSKAIDEFLALAYYNQFRLPVVILRLFNTVGPRQTGQYGMVVPRFVQQALRNEPITVFGDGNQSRCFCDVSDVVWALHQLMEKPEAVGEVVNVGATEETSIRELAERVKQRTGSESEIVTIPYSEAYSAGFDDMQRRVPSIDKVRDLTGFAPQHQLDDIIDRVVAYEKQR